MKLKDIIKTVPGNIILDVREYDETRIYLGEAENYFLEISDEDLEKTIFTFFPGRTVDLDEPHVLIIYLNEEE